MATVWGVLLGRETGRIALATETDVLSLATTDDPVPASIRAGDEVAGWRHGAAVREIRLARIRTDAGLAGDGAAPGQIRLDTGARLWDLLAWPGMADGPGYLRVCHDGHLVLWAQDADGQVRLPPPPAERRKLRALG